MLPDLDLRVVAGEPAAALAGGGLRCDVPYDLDAVRPALAVAKTEASATADMTTCDWPVARGSPGSHHWAQEG